MQRILLHILILLSSAFTLSSQPLAKAHNSDLSITTFRSSTIDCEREQVIGNYISDYLGTTVTTEELAWTGDVDQCDEGAISALGLERTKNRINYFRNLVGIPNGIIFTETKNQKCQKAVLMMNAARALDHFPTTDWLCSSPEGIEAAGKSNLSYGAHSSASVPQYIRDAGSGNGAVGHRRWILFPRAFEFGFGSTNWGTAMWVIGGNQNPEVYPEYVAYPSPGYFPKNLIYPRWSFSKRSANFDEATITMWDEIGNTISFTREEITNGFGDNTLVWVPEINLNDNSLGSDSYFRVRIENVKVSGEYETFEYEVLGIVPEHTENQMTLTNPFCNDLNGSVQLDVSTGYSGIKWSNGELDTESIENLSAGSHAVTITDKLGCEQIINFELIEDNPPATISSIDGNLTPASSSSEIYATTLISNGSYEWSINGGTITSGVSSNEIQVTWDESASTGELCVVFSDESGCSSNEYCVEVEMTISSIIEIQSNLVSVSPNPFSEVITLEIPEGEILKEVEIVSLNGTLMQKFTADSPTDKIKIKPGNLPSGIYFLKLGLLNRIRTVKVIKK